MTPPTRCEQCRRAELTPWERLREDLLAVLGLGGPRTLDRAMRHFGSYAYIAAGLPVPTDYDRHRAEYERTGDPLELTRMLRHVK